MASSSSSDSFGIEPATKKRKCSPVLVDVFINHRGPDVKETLAQDLYEFLRKLRIEVFLDKELELGESFPAAIKSAIYSASVHIAIFSKGYAESAWCLAELSLMLKTKARIIPIFYDVEPSALRYIESGVYGNAFIKYRNKGRYLEKLDDWKKALQTVSMIKGYEYSKNKMDTHSLCESVGQAVRKELEKKKPLHVAQHPVGLGDLVKDFESHCRKKTDKVNMVGICGMGGTGKTTLAKEFFNLKRGEYDGSCFLCDVAESELPALQSKLLKDLVRNPDHLTKFENTTEGKSGLNFYMPQLRKYRFLIVLDDIDDKKQLEALWFRDALNPQSLVIVTTREEGLLIGIATLYKIEGMSPKHSFELFCRHAFDQPIAKEGYEYLVESFLKVCKGLPLYLTVLGDIVSNRDQSYWELILNDTKEVLNGEVKQVLKKSFDKLSSSQQRMFVDTACFFTNKPNSMAIRIWEVAETSIELSLQTLKEKCLVHVRLDRQEFDDEEHAMTMHDLNRDLGREIAKTLTPPYRLWHPNDLEPLEQKGFQNILKQAKERDHRFLHTCQFPKNSEIQYFVGNLVESGRPSTTALLWLELDLNWDERTSIHPAIPLQNVQCLKIVRGRLTRLWKKDAKRPMKLKELLLDDVELVECLQSLEKLNDLEKLVLRGRHVNDKKEMNALSLSNSLGQLRHLKVLVLRHVGLKGAVAFSSSTPNSPMNSLQKVHISEEKHVRKVSIKGARCPCIQSLCLESMQNLDRIDLSMVTTLNFLELRSCRNLKVILGISDLQNLAILKIRECPEVEMDSIAGLSSLERIAIDGCQKLQCITGIEDLQRLKYLHLSALGHGGVPKCISKLQRLPSEFTTVIGKAANGASSTLTDNLFSDIMGDGGGRIYIAENCMPEASLETVQHSLSAIILCAVVHTSNGETLQIPLPHNSIDSYIPKGEWIVTFVKTARLDTIPTVSFGTEIKKGCIIMMKNGEEGNALPILKKIVERIYET